MLALGGKTECVVGETIPSSLSLLSNIVAQDKTVKLLLSAFTYCVPFLCRLAVWNPAGMQGTHVILNRLCTTSSKFHCDIVWKIGDFGLQSQSTPTIRKPKPNVVESFERKSRSAFLCLGHAFFSSWTQGTRPTDEGYPDQELVGIPVTSMAPRGCVIFSRFNISHVG